MSGPYRDGGGISGPLRTVRFPRAVRLKWFVRAMYVVLIGGALTSLWGSAELRCDRAADVCVVSEWHSFVHLEHELRLTEIEGAYVEGGVFFKTPSRNPREYESMTRYSVEANQRTAEELVALFQRYLKHPTERSFQATLRCSPGYMFLATLGGVFLFVALALTTTKVVTARWGTMLRIDEGRRVIQVPRVGTKFPREVRMEEVMGVEVVTAAKRKNAPKLDEPPVYIALVLADGEKVAVTEPELANDDVEAGRERLAGALGACSA